MQEQKMYKDWRLWFFFVRQGANCLLIGSIELFSQTLMICHCDLHTHQKLLTAAINSEVRHSVFLQLHPNFEHSWPSLQCLVGTRLGSIKQLTSFTSSEGCMRTERSNVASDAKRNGAGAQWKTSFYSEIRTFQLHKIS